MLASIHPLVRRRTTNSPSVGTTGILLIALFGIILVTSWTCSVLRCRKNLRRRREMQRLDIERMEEDSRLLTGRRARLARPVIGTVDANTVNDWNGWGYGQSQEIQMPERSVQLGGLGRRGKVVR